MSVRVLVGLQWRRHRAALVPMAAAVGLFQFLLTRFAPTGQESWISRALETIPESLLALAGSDISARLTPARFLAVGYGHPFFLLLLGAWVVRASSGALAGEVGMGTIDLTASRAVPRWHFVTAGALTLAGGLLLMVLAAWGGTAAGSGLRKLDVAAAFVPVAISAGLLFAAWAGVGLAVSAVRRDGGSAIAWTTGLIAVSFVLEYIARLWEPVKGLRWLSLFRWYEPQVVVTGGMVWRDVAVCAGVAVVSTVAATLAFQRRDL